jgi:hypothetical protein
VVLEAAVRSLVLEQLEVVVVLEVIGHSPSLLVTELLTQ